MKAGIHPAYEKSIVTCASCGTIFETRATVPEIHVEICSVCHPFYTGKQKLIDTAGRVDRFRDRMLRSSQMQKPKKTKASREEGKLAEQTVDFTPEAETAEPNSSV